MTGLFDLTRIDAVSKEFLTGLDRALTIAAQDSIEFAKNHVRTQSDFTQRSPNSRSAKTATKGRVVRIPGGRVVRIISPVEHASHLEGGTAPHIIRPRKPGGVLRFQTRDGNIVFARFVRHPGTRATHFLSNAQLAAFEEFADDMTERTRQLANRFNRS